MVADLHGTVVVHRGIAGNDADDRRGDLFPGVELFFWGRIRWGGGWAELQKPGSQGVDIKGFPIKLGLHCGFALQPLLAGWNLGDDQVAYVVVPFRCLCPGRTNWWMMTDLLDKKAITFVWSDILICLSQ